MNVIKLKKLVLKNFKGTNYASVDFEDITNIYGDNKLGKTTILDGFTWVMFDKDSKDRFRFEVQPLDELNNVIHMLETEAMVILEVNGRNVELKKILKEKWVKKRGEVDSELKGTETSYYVNELPVKLFEYKAKINSIIDEKLFKLISSPLYFSLNIKWEDRRKVLLDIIGDITSDIVITYNPSLGPLIKLLNDTDLDTFKKTTLNRIKKLNDDKKSIPYRVDELNNSINSGVDFDALTFRKYNIMAGIISIEEKLSDDSKLAQEVLKEKNRLYEIKSKLGEIEFKLKEESQRPLNKLKLDLRVSEEEIYKLENQVYRANFNFENSKNKVLYLERELQSLRGKYKNVIEEDLKISEEEFCCPTCKRAFEAENIESKKIEITNNFNENKAKKLKDINKIGEEKKKLLKKLQDEIGISEAELFNLNTRLDKLKSFKSYKKRLVDNFNPIVDFITPALELSQNVEYEKLKLEVEELEIKIGQLVEADGNKDRDNKELKTKKEELERELESVNNGLAFKEQNFKTKARIAELLEEERHLTERIAELESQEFLCEKYIKTKVELLESSINSKFKFVKFKLFNTLVNGAIEECCEALIDGVPFSNTNTSSQFNAGIDIINALTEYYKISAPVFIDNRESVNEIINCNSQIINLIVSKDKELVIERIKSEAVIKVTTNIVENKKDNKGPSF